MVLLYYVRIFVNINMFQLCIAERLKMEIKVGAKLKDIELETSQGGTRLYSLVCKSTLIPLEFNLVKESELGNGVIATFKGYRIKCTDYIRFVMSNPMALLELPTYDRVAVDYALLFLNSDEVVNTVS